MRNHRISIALTAFVVVASLALSGGGVLAHPSDAIEVIAGPPGSGGDADLIENALLACPPGGTVELYGHFRVDRSIKVTGFSGQIKGQGMDATIVEAVGPFGRTWVPIANVELGDFRSGQARDDLGKRSARFELVRFVVEYP